MNITELARRLRITTNQLHDVLPQMGFDIGRRAIKVDNSVAQKIIQGWGKFQAAVQKQKEEDTLAELKSRTTEPVTISLPPVITVRDFAVTLNIPVTKLMQVLMNNGILTAMNEKIDFESASIIAEDLGFIVQEEIQEESVSMFSTSDAVRDALEKESKSSLLSRPPVVVIMGHVDHGKTTLLDAIRSTNVVAQESGGITQHIGAYQVEVPAHDEEAKKKKKKEHSRFITFIDTPGHEAFTTMRSRGAKVADVAILVVAADDSVKPQTIEAIKIIKAAALPMVVAINKIDKEGANLDKVKRELSDLGIIPEDWGGKTICVSISAKQRLGLDTLLEMILLVADMDKEKIVANPKGEALASVIESHIDKNEGPVATVLVQNGTLMHNDHLVIDTTLYGKIRAMKDHRGHTVMSAPPSCPVRIIGFKNAPAVGDVVRGAKTLGKEIEKEQRKMATTSTMIVTPKHGAHKESGGKTVNVILKADKLGSLEAVETALTKIEHPEVRVSIVSKELGNITSADVLSADATGSFIAGFHVTTTTAARDIANEKDVEIKLYKIIYELLDDVKGRIEALISPEKRHVGLGKAKVLAIFRSEPNHMIVGAAITEGVLERNARVRVLRGEEVITEGKVTRLQSGKQEINKAISGQECGLSCEGKNPIENGDVVEAFREDTLKRTLE